MALGRPGATEMLAIVGGTGLCELPGLLADAGGCAQWRPESVAVGASRVSASAKRAGSASPKSVGGQVCSALMGALAPCMAAAAMVAPLGGSPGALPQAPWAFSGLPGQTLPVTRFVLERQDVGIVLRVQTAASYGNLVHALKGVPAGRLSWRWRVDKALASADLRSREGDDVALKVCALFDMPRSAVPFVERQLLRLAESRSGQSLPTATLCYAWDPSWPEGTVVANAYTRRVRYITLGGKVLSWQAVQRDLAADFVRTFGDETTSVPRLLAIALGADADNTRGESLGFIADLEFTPGPER